jgi:hypothetical protein
MIKFLSMSEIINHKSQQMLAVEDERYCFVRNVIRVNIQCITVNIFDWSKI